MKSDSKVKEDFLKKEISIGDTVCFAPAGAYAGILVGVVEKFTPKRVCITAKIRGRHLSLGNEKYYAPPEQIVVINL